MKWDCRKIKALLRSVECRANLKDIVSQVVSTRRVQGRGWPEHFFEVELRGIVRYKDDKLMDPLAVGNYLSQAAPLPFSPEFKFGDRIESEFISQFALSKMAIHIDVVDGYIDHIETPFSLRKNFRTHLTT